MTGFWLKVQIGSPTECWPWLCTKHGDGYGLVRWPGQHSMIGTHRAAWMLARGPIPAGLHVLHSCDNPPCCNPAHLFLGTNADNVADKVAKGRCQRTQAKRRGELHPMAKLSRAQVDEIRASSTGERGEGLALAQRYGVCRASISQIVNGRSWR